MTDSDPVSEPTSPGASDSTFDLRREMLAACERFEWEWRRGGHCDIDTVLADVPSTHRDLVRGALEELAEELRAETPPDSSSQAPFAKRFEVRRPLASGGMGVVSEAFDREFRRVVALKEILPAGADDAAYRQRFLTEAEITGRLEHPGIIPVYSRGTQADGRPYYAMRLITGARAGTLQQAVKQWHTAPPDDLAERDLAWRGLLRRVIDVCHTMAYVHSQGVLHRDLKPANILLGPYGETLVVDWGLAKDLRGTGAPVEPTPDGPPGSVRAESRDPRDADSDTRRGLGTLGHAAPEQLTGESVPPGPASDIYSLGTILYSVLTGQAPFPSALWPDPSAALQKVSAGDFPKPTLVNPRVDPALEAICLKAMSREPGERYPTATALADDLERYLAGEAVSAWREPWTVALPRWMGRHRTLVTTTAVALVLTALGSIGMALLQSRNKQALATEGQKLAAALEVAQTERQVAEREREQADQERARATDASARAETERARAVEREALAVKAVDEFRLAVMSNPELASSSKLGALRLNLLRKPLEFYRQLREQLLALPEPSLDNLWKLRDASSRLAVLHTDVGDLTEAIKLHESVLELCERALQHPELLEPGQRRLWGTARVVAHLSIGTTLARTEDKSRELQAYERALAASETLLAETPDDRQLNAFRASALSGAASVLVTKKRWDEARQRFEQAAELHRANIARHPQDAEARRNLARSQTNFAGLLEGLGDSAGAAAARQEAETLFAGTGDNQPKSPESRHREAANQFNRGIQLARSGQLDQALKAYEEAATGWRRLGQDFPANNEYAKALRPVLMNISTLLERRQKSAECLAVLDELIGLLHTALEKSPGSSEYKGQLLDALHMQGHHQFATGQDEEAQRSYTAGEALARQMIIQAGHDLRWTRHLVELSQHLAALDVEADELAQARERLDAIAPTALVLVSGASVEPVDRILLRSVLGTLAEIQDNQEDLASATETRRLSLTWDERDPAMQALDRRVQEVVAGAEPQSLAERISLAKRLATRDELAAALRLCVGVLESQPELAADRQGELGYLAACLAVAQAARLPADRAQEGAKLRGRALHWLQQELGYWRQVVPALTQTRRHALRRWTIDPFLASVSREERRLRLPEAEQDAWRTVFTEARQLAAEGTPVQ